MTKLAGDGLEGISLCESLANAYEAWINDREAELTDVRKVPVGFRDVAGSHLELCRSCLSRIRRGIYLLRTDHDVALAFALATKPCTCSRRITSWHQKR